MGKIWIKEFTGGLDTRRMPETTSGAVLTVATNGHITRGGEFEKRQAFVPLYNLPNGKTKGLAVDGDGLVVFGRVVTPGVMPAGVRYEQLEHPTNPTLQVDAVTSFDLYSGLLYVSARFEDGSVHLFYDGANVNSWADGYAHGWFKIDNADITDAVSGYGSFRVTGGTNVGADKITSIKVGGKQLISSAVQHTGDDIDTASDIRDEINARTGTSGFSATSSYRKVKIKAPAGDSYNGEDIITVVGGAFVVGDVVKFAGGADAIIPTLKKLWLGGKKIIGAEVPWTTNTAAMAQDVADAINAYSGTSGYTATASFAKVRVTAVDQGSDPNGNKFTYLGDDGFRLDDQQKMSGGSEKSLPKGTFLKTVDTKVYAVSKDVLYFSGVAAPTGWTTDNVGAGFIDLSTKLGGAENLKAIAKFQNYIAIFGETTTLIEYVDPDPALNKSSQTLENTGTISAPSVTQYGDTDIYYLDESGIRSLRARYASESASTSDTGVAIDELVKTQLNSLSSTERANCIGVIEPRDGRYWLAMKNVIYVFSYFPGAKVSAWTQYTPTTFYGGVEVPFDIEQMVVFDKRIYIRSGDTIYVYGGLDSTDVYDATVAEVRLPYLDAGDPTRLKKFTGLDVACEGTWRAEVAFDPRNTSTTDIVGTVTGTTYMHDRIGGAGDGTHISLRFTTHSASAAKLASVCILYQGDEIEDR